MERTVAWLGVALPEQVLFLLKSGVFLCASGVILYVALAPVTRRFMTHFTTFDTLWPWFLVTKQSHCPSSFPPFFLFRLTLMGRRYQYLLQSVAAIRTALSLF